MAIGAALARLIHSWADTMLAPACGLCGAEAVDARLCSACVQWLEHSGSACARCAEPLPAAAPLCGKCLKRAPAFDAAQAGFIYRAPFDHLVQRFKFNDALAVGRALAPIWSDRLRSYLRERASDAPDALIPIPLHRARLRQRGYNQALELARDLGATLQIPVLAEGLLRTRSTAPMPGLDLPERRRNIRRAFAPGSESLPQRVALIDDVMTSGATLNEAARTLKRSGVKWVEAWVLARRP